MKKWIKKQLIVASIIAAVVAMIMSIAEAEASATILMSLFLGFTSSLFVPILERKNKMENTNINTPTTSAEKPFIGLLNMICWAILLLLKSIWFVVSFKWFIPLCDFFADLIDCLWVWFIGEDDDHLDAYL